MLSAGWIQTLDLRIYGQVLYQRARAAGLTEDLADMRHDFQLNGIQQYNNTIDALPFSEAVNTWTLTSSSGCRWPWQWFLPPWSPPTQRQRTL